MDSKSVIVCGRDMYGSPSWGDEEFEHAVASALIACFEKRLVWQESASKNAAIHQGHLDVFRKIGPFFPAKDREAIIEQSSSPRFDVANDDLPLCGSLSVNVHYLLPSLKLVMPHAKPHFASVCFRRVSSYGDGWLSLGLGRPYEMLVLQDTIDGIVGWRHMFTVGAGGSITSCVEKGCMPSRPADARNFANLLSIAMQYSADARFSWSIVAKEDVAHATLGAGTEEVKSLLYARSMPITATGRKRPILHLVEAHRRRIKAGTDVDVTAFLRGVQSVEIGGTQFTVKPPQVLKPEVSEPSRRKYFGPVASVA